MNLQMQIKQLENSSLEKVISAIQEFTGSPMQVNVITEAIQRDHDDLKKFLKLLKDEKTLSSVKRRIFGEFASLLLSHSTSEEKAMYELSQKLPGLKQKTLEGYVEHKVAADLLKKIVLNPATKELPGWLAQVQVLAELVEHHIEEEESDLLPEVRKEMSQRMQVASCQKFIKLRRASQKKVGKNNAGVLAAQA